VGQNVIAAAALRAQMTQIEISGHSQGCAPISARMKSKHPVFDQKSE